ncbi:MAG: RidA family protein [Lentisphaeria bacterium]|nr:RidA family protein [Lentisphaeria bacterium]
MKKIISTPNAPAAVGPYSQAVKAGNLLFCSGQIALDPSTGVLAGDDIETQAGQVMKNISAVLEAAGATCDDVVKTTCFLADINDFAGFNAVYARCFPGKPARSCVAAAALPKGALVEVEVTAVCREPDHA